MATGLQWHNFKTFVWKKYKISPKLTITSISSFTISFTGTHKFKKLAGR